MNKRAPFVDFCYAIAAAAAAAQQVKQVAAAPA
jgi:hypothetical protein